MLGRKKKPAAAPAQSDTIPATVSPRRPTAAEAHALIHAAVTGRDAAARLYLVLSETVGQGGVADAWRYMYLLPGVHAEAEALVTANLMPSGSYRISSVWDVVPFPRPGSTEAIMARGGPLAAKMAEERWAARLTRLKGLDVPFVDSPHALKALDEKGAHSLYGGPARMKARMLPIGTTVWEIANSYGTFHVPLSLARWVAQPA